MALLLLSLILLIWPHTVGAEEPVPIRKVLADPGDYHLTKVTLTGTVSQVEPLEPYPLPSGAVCYGAFTFTLQDATGSLPIAVLGICGTPVYRPPTLSDGDRVRVHVHIQAPGTSGYFRSELDVRVPRTDPESVRAIAMHIQSPIDGQARDE